MIIEDGKLKTDDETMSEYIESACENVKVPDIDIDEWEKFWNDGNK